MLWILHLVQKKIDLSLTPSSPIRASSLEKRSSTGFRIRMFQNRERRFGKSWFVILSKLRTLFLSERPSPGTRESAVSYFKERLLSVFCASCRHLALSVSRVDIRKYSALPACAHRVKPSFVFAAFLCTVSYHACMLCIVPFHCAPPPRHGV